MSQSKNNRLLCLCVELDADFFYLIQSYAERSGLRAEIIQRGSEVVEKTLSTHPAMIFLESDHPAEMPAWEVLQALKAHPETQAIPTLVFSWLDEEDIALGKGADVFVRKPVMLADFQDALSSAGIEFRTKDVDAVDEKRR
jgi:CheY-like chemotaxis protein